MQGGLRLHTIDKETKLKPRIFGMPKAPLEGDQEVYKYLTNKEEQEKVMSGEEQEEPIPDLIDGDMPAWNQAERELSDSLESDKEMRTLVHQRSWPIEPRRVHTGFQEAEKLTQGNRGEMDKFEPLSINGQKITNYEIGGFKIDLPLVAAKYREIIPLPPSKLPIIFSNDELNFYHHFFQGLDTLIGADTMAKLVASRTYHEKSAPKVIGALAQHLVSGYQPCDTELTVFVKKVLTSTFDINGHPSAGASAQSLHVSANIWGFQYLEQGMTCRDSDLCMWLNQCHLRYRTVWFNTFKSSGVPSFATDGAKPDTTSADSETRSYAHPPRSKSSRHHDVSFDTARHRGDDMSGQSSRSIVSHRSRSSKTPQRIQSGGIRDWIRNQSSH
jgi:hypothetical protein